MWLILCEEMVGGKKTAPTPMPMAVHRGTAQCKRKHNTTQSSPNETKFLYPSAYMLHIRFFVDVCSWLLCCMKSMLTPSSFFVFAVFWAKSKPLIIPESKKDNLSLTSPAVKVKCVYRSVLGLSQPLAQFFMIKGGGGDKKPVGQPATWSHAQCCPWPG